MQKTLSRATASESASAGTKQIGCGKPFPVIALPDEWGVGTFASATTPHWLLSWKKVHGTTPHPLLECVEET